MNGSEKKKKKICQCKPLHRPENSETGKGLGKGLKKKPGNGWVLYSCGKGIRGEKKIRIRKYELGTK